MLIKRDVHAIPMRLEPPILDIFYAQKKKEQISFDLRILCSINIRN